MPKAKLYNQEGKDIGQVDLDPKIFSVKPNPGLIEQAIVTQLSNRRQPLAHTKTKAEVRGGGRKPWRQKGTGRARHGSIRSPQWKGGGVIFGPRSTRSYARHLPVSAKRSALRMVLSDKASNDQLTVVDKIALPEAKTKLVAGMLKKLTAPAKTLLILPTSDRVLVRAGRNIPGLLFIRADSLNVYDVLNSRRLLIVQDALPVISKTYLK